MCRDGAVGHRRCLEVRPSIEGGDPPRQELLAAEFGCSLIPGREALLGLKGEGLVEFICHKGAIAKEITITEVDEIFALRALLECDILARVRAGDKRGAVKALRDHILVTGEKLIASLTALGSLRES